MTTALLLNSGGFDTFAVALRLAARRYDKLYSLFVDYGQRAAPGERRAARYLSKQLGAEFIEAKLDLPGYRGHHLTTKNTFSFYGYDDTIRASQRLHALERMPWCVPLRSVLFLTMAAAEAQSRGVDEIWTAYDDNPIERVADKSGAALDYLESMIDSATEPSSRTPVFHHPHQGMTKTEVASAAFETMRKTQELDLYRAWSCQNDQPQRCGVCQSCVTLRDTLVRIGQPDRFRYLSPRQIANLIGEPLEFIPNPEPESFR